MNRFFLFSILFFSLFIVACEEEETIIDSNSSSPVIDSELAALLVEEANDELYDELMWLADTEPPEDPALIDEWIDLSDPYELYNQALDADPNNPGANFGAAFTELLMVSQDDLFKETLDSWVDCIDSFDDDSDDYRSSESSPSVLNLDGFQSMIPVSDNAFTSFSFVDILNYLPIISPDGNILMDPSDYCPEIESLQILLEDSFLARISTAIDRFDLVVGSDFEFIITADMMDDDDQEQITLDDTEFYLMKAALHMMRAVMYAAIAYDVNIPYYDMVEEGSPDVDYNWDFLSQDSDFLTIRLGHENTWGSAHDDLNNIVSSVSSSWSFLNGDIDTQFDVILLADIEDGDEVDSYLEDADALLNEEYYLPNLSDEDEDIPDVTVDISGFLNNPPEDMKDMLPDYTIYSTTCEQSSGDWEWDYYEYYVTWDYSWYDPSCWNSYNYFNFEGECRWDDEEGLIVETYIYDNYGCGTDGLTTDFSSVVENYCQSAVDQIGEGYQIEDFYMNFWHSNEYAYNNAYNNDDYLYYYDYNYSSDDWVYYQIAYSESYTVGCPGINWEAGSCDEWKNGWDITVGGLFPHMTPEEMFEDFSEEDCEDILDGGFD